MTSTLRWLWIPTILCVLTTAIFAQKAERKLIYTAASGEELPELMEKRSVYTYPNAHLLSMFFVREAEGYRVFHNGVDKGLYSYVPGLIPEVDFYGNLILPILMDGGQGVEINGVQHGPFKKIKSAEVSNGHLLIEHYDPETKKTFLYLDNKNVRESLPGRGLGLVRVDAAGNLIRDESRNYSTGAATAIFVNDSVLCTNCGIGYNNSAGKYYFFLYRNHEDKAKGLDTWHYLLNGQRYGPVSNYWVPRIDSFGNFVMPHEWEGKEYVQINLARFGPIRNVKSVRSSTGAFGVLFKFQAPEDLKFPRHLYADGMVLGPYDSIQVYQGSNVYYFETEGKRRLGQNGRTVFEFPEGVKMKSFQSGDQGRYLFTLTDGSVYIDGHLHKKYGNLENAALLDDGYYVLYRNEQEQSIVEVDGREINCGDLPAFANWSLAGDGMLFSTGHRHFLKFSRKANYFYVDGQRYESPSEDIRFYNLLSENAFAWLTVEGNKYYWHYLKLD